MQACLASFAGIVMACWLPKLVPRIQWVPVVRMHGSMGAVNPGQDDGAFENRFFESFNGILFFTFI